MKEKKSFLARIITVLVWILLIYYAAFWIACLIWKPIEFILNLI